MRVIGVLVLMLSFLPTAWANKEKDYPESGKVVSFRTTVEQNVSGQNGDVDTTNFHRRIYRVETETMVYEFTGWENVFKQHSRPPMVVGETIHFRMEKNKAYIRLSDGREHTFLVMSAESKK